MSEIEKAINCLSTFIKTLEHYEAQEEETKAMKIAVQALQEKLERENPQLLTLEEIMAIKQPVPLFKILILDDTGEYIGANNRWWDVCCGTTAQSGLVYWRSGHVNRVEDYGVNWVAYWNKPKDIEHIGEATNMVEGE